MGEDLAKLSRIHTQAKRRTEHALVPKEEQRVLVVLRREARAAGSTLATGGKGGLPPSLVLNVMRRDEYRCKKCGGAANLIVHHKGGLENPTSEWLAKKQKSNDTNNIVTLCTTCHDSIHTDDKS